MADIRIYNINKLDLLRNEIASFSNTALYAIQTLKQHINEQYIAIERAKDELGQKKEHHEQAYSSAKDAYNCCKQGVWEDENGNTHYPNCSVEKNHRDDAYYTLERTQSQLSIAKGIFYKAKDWLYSFNKHFDRFQKLAGNTSQDSIRYLDNLSALGKEYIALSLEYGNVSTCSSTADAYSSDNNTKAGTIKKFGNKFEKEMESDEQTIEYIFNDFLVKTTTTKNSNKKKFTTWNIADKDNPDESLLTLKMNNETKSATIGDIKAKDAFWQISKEHDAIALMEQTAKKAGCKTIGSWVNVQDLSFFKKNGYQILKQSDTGAEIFKKI